MPVSQAGGSPSELHQHPTRIAPKDAHPMSRDPCIAVVDDDRDLRDLLDRYLRGFGMRVRGFADGESFLREVAAGSRMDAVVLDLM